MPSTRSRSLSRALIARHCRDRALRRSSGHPELQYLSLRQKQRAARAASALRADYRCRTGSIAILDYVCHVYFSVARSFLDPFIGSSGLRGRVTSFFAWQSSRTKRNAASLAAVCGVAKSLARYATRGASVISIPLAPLRLA